MNFALSPDFFVPVLVYLCNIWYLDLGFADGKEKNEAKYIKLENWEENGFFLYKKISLLVSFPSLSF